MEGEEWRQPRGRVLSVLATSLFKFDVGLRRCKRQLISR